MFVSFNFINTLGAGCTSHLHLCTASHAHVFCATWVSWFWVPHTLALDRGATIHLLQVVSPSSMLHNAHITTTAFHPQSNGSMESSVVDPNSSNPDADIFLVSVSCRILVKDQDPLFLYTIQKMISTTNFQRSKIKTKTEVTNLRLMRPESPE